MPSAGDCVLAPLAHWVCAANRRSLVQASLLPKPQACLNSSIARFSSFLSTPVPIETVGINIIGCSRDGDAERRQKRAEG